MRKSILMILTIIAAAVLAVGFSGCLGLADAEKEAEVAIKNPAGVQSASVVTNGDNLVAHIQVIIYGTHSQKIDTENIKVDVSGRNVNVDIPVIETSDRNTRDIGYETITVVLGKKNQFEDGDYKLIINGGTGKEFITDFKVLEKIFYFTKDASIQTSVIEAQGNKIILNTTVSLGGSAETVDRKNITMTGSFEKNDVNVKIPTQMKDGITTLNIAWENVAVEIGQLDQLEDGTYTITVNGEDISFTIKNNKIVSN